MNRILHCDWLYERVRWRYLVSLWMETQCVTIPMKAIEQCFLVVLFIMLYKLTFKSVDETLVSDHSNERYMWYRLQGCVNFEVCVIY